jgi:hypothetical protein
VVNFTPRPLYLRGKSPRYPLDIGVGSTPEAVSATWRRENSCPYRDSNPDPSAVQPEASRYTDCAIPIPILKLNIKEMGRGLVSFRSGHSPLAVYRDVPQKAENFFTSWPTVSFSRITELHGDGTGNEPNLKATRSCLCHEMARSIVRIPTLSAGCDAQ